jgi:hypothetical protein
LDDGQSACAGGQAALRRLSESEPLGQAIDVHRLSDGKPRVPKSGNAVSGIQSPLPVQIYGRI